MQGIGQQILDWVSRLFCGWINLVCVREGMNGVHASPALPLKCCVIPLLSTVPVNAHTIWVCVMHKPFTFYNLYNTSPHVLSQGLFCICLFMWIILLFFLWGGGSASVKNITFADCIECVWMIMCLWQCEQVWSIAVCQCVCDSVSRFDPLLCVSVFVTVWAGLIHCCVSL